MYAQKMQKKKQKTRKKNWISVSKYHLNQKSIAHFFLERKSFSRLLKKLGRIWLVGFYGKALKYGQLMYVKHRPF